MIEACRCIPIFVDVLFRYRPKGSFWCGWTRSLFILLVIISRLNGGLMIVGSGRRWFAVRIIVWGIVVPFVIQPMRSFHQDQKPLEAFRVHGMNLHDVILQFWIHSIRFLTKGTRSWSGIVVLRGLWIFFVFGWRPSVVFLAFGTICKGKWKEWK